MAMLVWLMCVTWTFYSYSIYGPVGRFQDHIKSVQKMRDVRIGLVGMLISVWVIIASILTKDSVHYWNIDLAKMSHYKIVKFVTVIGIIHVVFAVCFIEWNIEYLLILVLTTTSFFFSVDLYTAMSAKSYMFREHYHYDCESQQILYHQEIVVTSDGKQSKTIQWSLL
ncbi:Protein CBG03592 [Caenorhabditis briggsae]|uniref:Protein CBG03592 n=1 Tax=Caenorhabditis briggsae TaxID=6238 RepID=A8WVE8_CAEBR|nr:Protein CBG03592 [Caenorhabditis briggsae]CAP24459.2 Protein CBG03592 [Caenorhabditis briggsae]